MTRIPAYLIGLLAFYLLTACSSHPYNVSRLPDEGSGYVLPAQHLPKDQEALQREGIMTQNRALLGTVDSIFYEGRYLAPEMAQQLFDTLDMSRHDLTFVAKDFSTKKNLNITLKK